MNRYDCETIRDQLPPLLRGEMLPHEAIRIERHLEECDDCSAEAEVIRLLQSSLAPVPPDLEAKVLFAVRRRARRGVPARLAMAATVAAAVIGGALLVQSRQGGAMRANDVDAVTWAAAEDPLLHGGVPLEDLTVEELEHLLEELEP